MTSRKASKGPRTTLDQENYLQEHLSPKLNVRLFILQLAGHHTCANMPQVGHVNKALS